MNWELYHNPKARVTSLPVLAVAEAKGKTGDLSRIAGFTGRIDTRVTAFGKLIL